MLWMQQNLYLRWDIIISDKKQIASLVIGRNFNMKNIAEKLKSSTSLMITYGVLSAFSIVAGLFWNITKYGFK